MHYISSITGVFFILVGLCFVTVSTRVNKYGNKFCFFLFGILTLFLGVYPFLIPRLDFNTVAE